MMKDNHKDPAGEQASQLFVQTIYGIGKELQLDEMILRDFMAQWNSEYVAAKTVVFEPGQMFDEIWFVAKGCVKATRVVKDNPWTYLLAVEGQFTCEYFSYVGEGPARMTFEAIVDSIIYRIKKEKLDALCTQYPEMQQVRLYFARYAYSVTFHRILNLQMKKLKERYLTLLEQAPSVIAYVPQQDIASYLGAKSESLSRLKSEIMKELKQKHTDK